MIPENVKLARAAHEAAAKALIEAAKAAYPVGCVVGLTLGRCRIWGKVVGHSDSWWYDPGTVRVRNVVTGKERKFAAHGLSYAAEVIELDD